MPAFSDVQHDRYGLSMIMRRGDSLLPKIHLFAAIPSVLLSRNEASSGNLRVFLNFGSGRSQPWPAAIELRIHSGKVGCYDDLSQVLNDEPASDRFDILHCIKLCLAADRRSLSAIPQWPGAFPCLFAGVLRSL